MDNTVVKVVAAAGLLAGAGVAAFMLCKHRSQQTSLKFAHAPVSSVKGEAAGTVLCSINGQPVIYERDFKQSMEQMLQQSFKGASPEALPMAIKRRFFDQLVQQELIVCQAEKAHLEDNPEFVKAYDDMSRMLKRHLMVQFVEKDIYDHIKISDTDIAKHYEENKARYVKDAGGILTTGVKFGSESEASTFLKKAANDAKKFEDQAKAASKEGNFKDFGRISKEARGYAAMSIPAPVRDAVTALKDFPHLEMVKAGKEFWVVLAQDSKEPVYFDLAEINPQIQGMLKNTKFKDVLDDQLNEIRKKELIVINEEFFKEPEKDAASHKAIEKLAQAAVKQNMLNESALENVQSEQTEQHVATV